VVDLAAREAGYRLIDVLVFGNVFGREALNEVSGPRAAVEEERHGASVCSTLDQKDRWRTSAERSANVSQWTPRLAVRLVRPIFPPVSSAVSSDNLAPVNRTGAFSW
jgi:hypothetical protein